MPTPNSAVSNTYRSIWNISYPIIIGLVAQNLMVVIDTAFLGRLGEVSLGAAAIGGLFYLTLVMFGAGFAIGMQIIIGRRNGEGRQRTIGRIFDHGLYFMVGMALLLILFLSLAGPSLLGRFISSPAILEQSLVFISYRRFGYFFGFLIMVFNSFYVGIVRTRMVSVATIIMATSNIVLDYGLIFGKLGLPEMGISGAALATNLAEFITFLFYLLWSFKNKCISSFRLLRFHKPRKRLYDDLLKLSLPVMLQHFISFSAWFIFFMILEKIGETALAASNITRSIYMLLMIPVWGLSSATTTLVSNIIGQGKSDEVMPMIKKIMTISFIANLLLIQVLIFFPRTVISFFTQSPELVEATLPLLRVITLSLTVFSVSMIIFSALSGTGKTGTALRIEVISIILYLLFAFILAVGFDAPASGVWFVEVLYFTVIGVFAYIFLKRGTWKELVV
ncbi:MAG: MATE family efflux transporter [Bacteroidales bacterium]|jgi:putative MATE family efflux protein|nr:MATE family efflux transporter [Bacteroidales bacterium]NLM91554.1 MATE family efflux transporter [Bacteroidales bacterium]